MQEIIVFSIAIIALVYLLIKFFGKQKAHDCNKCDSNDNNKPQEY
jgi:hypothetical protein